MRKICVVTGSRAEYGLLSGLLQSVEKERNMRLQLVVTGMHLSPEFGLTYKEIEDDGLMIAARVETLLSSDTPVGIAKSMGLGTIGFADAFARLRPDLLVLLGDRYEVFAAAQAALVMRLPVAHIAGGDVTEGAFDDALRHSITKMAHLHFVTNEISRRRVLQLGEDPDRVFNVGHLGLDRLDALPKMSRAALEKELPFKFREKNLLITFHPVTLDAQPSGVQFEELTRALEELGIDVGLIFTHSNADTEGRSLIRQLEEFTARHPNAAAFPSLGQRRYLSLMAQADAVVGNSSSGLYEAPSLHKPTVNIGDRQKGRLMAESVICCPPDQEAIKNAILRAFKTDCSAVINPYGSGGSAAKIIEILRAAPNFKALLKKKFHDIDWTDV